MAQTFERIRRTIKKTVATVITYIATHVRPDIEELLAIVMLILHGEKVYPGVSTAKLTFVNPEMPDYEHHIALHPEVLPVGVWHGDLDEHPMPGFPNDPAKKGKCAATLVAEKLGIANNPEWKKLLTSVTANDLWGIGSPFDVAYILKVLYDNADKSAISWALMAIRAVHHEEKKNVLEHTTYDFAGKAWLFDRIFTLWLKLKFGKEEISKEAQLAFAFDSSDKQLGLALQTAKELGVEDNQNLNFLLNYAKARPVADNMFGIKGLPALILQYYSAVNPEMAQTAALDWAFRGIEAKYQEQKYFLEVTGSEFKKKAKIKKFKTAGRKRKLKLVTVRSDVRYLAKYARSKLGGGCAVIIQKTTAGNVQIFTNKVYGLNLDLLSEKLRLAEQEAMGKVEVTDPAQLRAEGMLANWYYHHEGQMLLNGSLKAVVPPTLLSLKKIRELVLECLSN